MIIGNSKKRRVKEKLISFKTLEQEIFVNEKSKRLEWGIGK